MKPFLIPLLFVGSFLQAEDWPQFKGRSGNGVSTGKALPAEFSEKENIAWKTNLGDGLGSPVVQGDRVFTTAMTADQKFTVFALDTASGSPLWRTEFATGALPRITPPNSHASSTPATAQQAAIAQQADGGRYNYQ
jgi:outer membrane protein assembly factor BamB